MNEWPSVSLGEIAEFGSGGTPSMSEPSYWDGDIPWISAASLTQPRLASSDRNVTRAAIGNGTKIAPAGSTLLLVRGMSLHKEIRVGRATRDLAFNQDVKSLRAQAGVDETFLFYALEGRREELLNMVHSAGHGTGVLATDRLQGMQIALPEIHEQRRIAGVVGALDDLIETNRHIIQNLRAQTASAFRALKTSGEPRRFFEVFDVDFGAAFKGQYFCEPGTGLPLLRIRDLKTQRSDTWTTERIAGDVLVQPGDVVVGMDAEFRPTLWLGRPSLLNQRVCRVRAKGRSAAWTREALAAPLAFVEGHKTGTTVAHLNKRDMEELRIVVPEDAVGARFDAIAQPLFDAIVSLAVEVDELTRTRDELLPLLMSGKVRAREVA